MIIRIVKMEFKPEEVETFQALFQQHKHLIRSFPGVERLELLQDTTHKNIFFTYSWWRSPDDLENYRQSGLFQTVWKQTKVLFNAKPQAWSLTQVDIQS